MGRTFLFLLMNRNYPFPIKNTNDTETHPNRNYRKSPTLNLAATSTLRISTTLATSLMNLGEF
jgi:hypothetical protein